MTPNRHAEAQRIVGRVEDGTATESDVVTLLIYLREYLDSQDPVRDIANCAAHTRRDRQGIAFAHIDTFVRELVNVAQRSGTLHVKVLFPIADVVDWLIDDLQRLGLRAEPDRIRQQSALLRDHLGNILEGVTFKLRNPHVIACWFATAAGKPFPSFNVRFKG